MSACICVWAQSSPVVVIDIRYKGKREISYPRYIVCIYARKKRKWIFFCTPPFLREIRRIRCYIVMLCVFLRDAWRTGVWVGRFAIDRFCAYMYASDINRSLWTPSHTTLVICTMMNNNAKSSDFVIAFW